MRSRSGIVYMCVRADLYTNDARVWMSKNLEARVNVCIGTAATNFVDAY